MFRFLLLFITIVFSQEHFIVELVGTGESTLFIFEDTITSLDVGDEIGLFDSNGVVDSAGNTGEVLVGAGVWQGTQLNIVAISSTDLSQFGGPVLPGAVTGNDLVVKVWDFSEQIELSGVTYDIGTNENTGLPAGNGTFSGLFTAINEINIESNENSFVDVSLNLLIGWNWLSLNVVSDDMSLDSVFLSVDGNGEFIKSQSGYADYYDGFGWFGTLDQINNTSMYKLRMINGDDLEFTGLPIIVDDTILNLSLGWNWIGYVPQDELDINVALENIPSGNAEFIKSQSGYADYYDGFGWFGTLDIMRPFEGYLLRMSEDTDFTYGVDVDGMARMSSAIDLSYNDFDLNIHDYEHNATMTSAIYINDMRVDSYDYVLAAYDNSKCVGHTEGLYFPLDGNVVFPLMVYGNEAGKTLTFKVYDKATQTYLDINEEFVFTPDMTLGDGFNPVVLNSNEAPIEHSISAAYPNPFNPVVNFDVELNGDHHVDARVYNISGQQVGIIYDGMLSRSSKLSWMATNQASGVYFIKVAVDGVLETSNKIVLLK